MRGVLLSLCAGLALVSGCDSSGAVTIGGGDAGAAGDSSEGPSADAGAAGAGACEPSGSGDIVLKVNGLPGGVDASIVIDQPYPGSDGQTATQSKTLSGVDGGAWGVLAKRVYDADPTVRTAYEPSVSTPQFCLADGGSQTVTVTYEAIASSNKLWTINGPGGTAPLLGFASALLTETSAPEVSAAVDAPAGGSLAFDFDGNAWIGGATVGDPTIARYAARSLGDTGTPLPDFAFNVPAIGCVPAVRGLALDSQGNLWLSTCANVLRIPKTAYTPGSGDTTDVEADVTLSGLTTNEDLAFDSAGNLWVASEDKVSRFDKARLAADDADAPDLTLSVTTDDATPKALAANHLAFDASGNLWAIDFAGNAAFEIAKADLSGTGEQTAVAVVHVTVDVEAVMSRAAFDDEGALWLSLAAGKFGKLTPAQLAVSSDAGAPTAPEIVLASPDVGYANGIAFFPAASGLPLASAQP